jgi:AraC family L-rhamnose operon transcriptional activator RhaR
VLTLLSKTRINPNEMICFIWDEDCVVDMPEHTHDFIELEYIYSGSGIQIVNGVEYPVSKGDVLFFNVGDVHSYRPIKDFSVINCMFLPCFIAKDNKTERENISIADIPPVIKLNGSNIIEVERLIMQMEAEFNEKQLGYLEMLKNYLGIIIIKIIRSSRQSEGLNKKMLPIVEYIENNYADIRPLDVAQHTSYNQSYLSKMFKDNLGMTITEYINNKRIENAICLLEDTNYSVEQICYMVGFKEKKYFYKCFKKITGLTPSAIRKKNHQSQSQS